MEKKNKIKYCKNCEWKNEKGKIRIIPSECCDAIFCDHTVSQEYIDERMKQKDEQEESMAYW